MQMPLRNSPLRDLKALPKGHLHLHLEGGMRPATLLDLAGRYGVPVTIDGGGSCETFIRLYRAACEVLRAPDDVVRLAREVSDDAAAGGATRVETTVARNSDQAS